MYIIKQIYFFNIGTRHERFIGIIHLLARRFFLTQPQPLRHIYLNLIIFKIEQKKKQKTNKQDKFIFVPLFINYI